MEMVVLLLHAPLQQYQEELQEAALHDELHLKHVT
jgi:hypothetical protein